jgi:hypothetical protein
MPFQARATFGGSAARFDEAPTLSGYLDQLYAIAFWTGLPWLWRLRQPTLVLTGDDDPIVPVINGRILAGLTPDARLQIIRGGGTCSCSSGRRRWRQSSPASWRRTTDGGPRKTRRRERSARGPGRWAPRAASARAATAATAPPASIRH